MVTTPLLAILLSRGSQEMLQIKKLDTCSLFKKRLDLENEIPNINSIKVAGFVYRIENSQPLNFSSCQSVFW
jgi:hypothetical protein